MSGFVPVHHVQMLNKERFALAMHFLCLKCLIAMFWDTALKSKSSVCFHNNM